MLSSAKGVIDIGTNSVKLLVMRRAAEGSSVLADRNEIARLGEGASRSGRLSDEAMARALSIIKDMAAEAVSLGCGEVLAIATQAVRAAANSSEFQKKAADECGVDVKIITGDEEADLSFRAVLSAISEAVSSVCVFDVGGGSSEIVEGGRSGCSYRRSVPLGALSLLNEFFGGGDAVSEETMSAARARVRHELLIEGAWRPSGCPLFAGVGGTITTLAAVLLSMAPYNPDKVSGTVLDSAEIDRQIKLYSSMSVTERAAIKGLDPKRADIILSGACIVRELMEFTGADRLTVLDRGLRYGVMERYFGLRVPAVL
jgi:exopolyphosphatase/guanosine-5'-triphosphate,3'-diphosphate pyrophosphatase